MERFIVGTGRCGSTLLSRMLHESPEAASIFEFFNGLDMARRFSEDALDGPALAELIAAEQTFITMVLRRGYEVPEVTYPFGTGGRFSRDDALPWILVSCLPRLCDDPDALYQDTLAFARNRPRQTLADHYRELFAFFAARTGKVVWIEKSGSSIDYIQDLHAMFPDARFLHLHRDGREAALSMREHHAYRLAISLLYGLDPALEARPDDTGEAADRIDALLGSRPAAEPFGRYWADQIQRGARGWKSIADPHFCQIRFEHLVSEPETTLGAIAKFFELDPIRDGWIARAAALVRGIPPTRLETLEPGERQALIAACEPGQALLDRG